MLPLMFLLAAATAPTAPADGVYTYTISVAGANTGKTSITLSHTPAGVQLVESASGSLGGSDFAATSNLALDGTLSPASYTAVYSPPGRTIHAALAFNAGAASETADNGALKFNLGPGTKHFVVLDGTLFSGFFILPAQLQAWSTPPVTALSPMFGHGGAIAVDTALKADRPKGIPAGDVAVSVSDPVEFTLWYDPATLIVDELDVPQQSTSYVRSVTR
jgi:hypothetical protein